MGKFLLFTCATLVAATLAIYPSTLSAHADRSAAVTESSSDSGAATENIESVEDIEVVQDVNTVNQSGLFQMIGRFHPLVLHFPIAWLMLLVLVELAALTGRFGELNRWGFALLVLTLLSFIPAIVSGLGLATLHADEGAEHLHKLTLHRNLNISSGLVLLVAGIVRLAIGQAAGAKARLGYFVLILAAAGLLVFGSHLGGEMVWGENFLPELF